MQKGVTTMTHDEARRVLRNSNDPFARYDAYKTLSTPEPLPPPERERKLDTGPRVDAVSAGDLRALREEIFSVLDDLTKGAAAGFSNTERALHQQELAMAQKEARVANRIADFAMLLASQRDHGPLDPTATTRPAPSRSVN